MNQDSQLLPTVRQLELTESELTLEFAGGEKYTCDPVSESWLEAAAAAEYKERSKRLLQAAVATWTHPESTVTDDSQSAITPIADASARNNASLSSPLIARAFTVGRADGISLGHIPTNTLAYPATAGGYIAALIEEKHELERPEASSIAAMTINDAKQDSVVGAREVTACFEDIPVEHVKHVCRLHTQSRYTDLPVWEVA